MSTLCKFSWLWRNPRAQRHYPMTNSSRLYLKRKNSRIHQSGRNKSTELSRKKKSTVNHQNYTRRYDIRLWYYRLIGGFFMSDFLAKKLDIYSFWLYCQPTIFFYVFFEWFLSARRICHFWTCTSTETTSIKSESTRVKRFCCDRLNSFYPYSKTSRSRERSPTRRIITW